MSDYIKDTFARMDLRQSISFLLYGTDDFAEETHPYKETLEKGCAPIYKRLESIYPDGPELDEATGELSHALTTYEYVYMELGMKAGARLLHQLLIESDLKPPEDE